MTTEQEKFIEEVVTIILETDAPVKNKVDCIRAFYKGLTGKRLSPPSRTNKTRRNGRTARLNGIL